MKRFDRLTSILLLLHTRRVVRGQDLADRFGVSVRTIYRDVRALEDAGLPLSGAPGVGYSLVEGYRLAPVAFTRDEATALLAAEKLAARLTDPDTARHARSAMDKVRSVLPPADRDHLEQTTPLVEVLGGDLGREEESPVPDAPPVYRDLLAAVGARRVVRLRYRPARGGEARGGEARERDVEPVGLYFQRRWYLAAFCRSSQDVRTFRLDGVEGAVVLDETYRPRYPTLRGYLDAQDTRRRALRPAVVRFTAEGARRVRDAKRHHGWISEETVAEGDIEMTFVPTTMEYLAAWLLPQAAGVTGVSPPALLDVLGRLAGEAHTRFTCL